MPDPKIAFVKELFNVTKEALAPKIQSLAVMCLDGDMYESKADELYHLYDKQIIAGYLTLNDWYRFPANMARKDFFNVYGMNVTIVLIDNLAVCLQKANKQIKT